MEIYTSIWHLLSAILIFLFGSICVHSLARKFQVGQRRALVIYLWHTAFCMVYLWYAGEYGGDSHGYYLDALEEELEFSPGTVAVTYLTSVLVQWLGLSILGAFLFFNIIGSIGLLAFDASLRVATIHKTRFIKNLATLIVFLPSISFWSSAIGKDSLAFMSCSLTLWASLNIRQRWLLMIVAIILMLAVRPHIAAMIVAAWIAAILVTRSIAFSRKMAIGGLLVSIATLLVPFALNYAGISEISHLEDVTKYVDMRASYNREGGGAVDIAAMGLPMQLITYMFRPFIFEVNSIFSLAAAIDNLILLCVFVLGAIALIRGRTSGLGECRAFMWIYSLFAWIALAMTTANLGIALRQKWMFAPMIIFLLISLISEPTRSVRRSRVLATD